MNLIARTAVYVFTGMLATAMLDIRPWQAFWFVIMLALAEAVEAVIKEKAK